MQQSGRSVQFLCPPVTGLEDSVGRLASPEGWVVGRVASLAGGLLKSVGRVEPPAGAGQRPSSHVGGADIQRGTLQQLGRNVQFRVTSPGHCCSLQVGVHGGGLHIQR